MVELKVCKLGILRSVLPKEAVSRLHADEGIVFSYEGPNGAYQLIPNDPAEKR